MGDREILGFAPFRSYPDADDMMLALNEPGSLLGEAGRVGLEIEDDLVVLGQVLVTGLSKKT
jgi:hypothetical protein